MNKSLSHDKALQESYLEYGRFIQSGEGSLKAIERAIETYNYVMNVKPGEAKEFDCGDNQIHEAIPDFTFKTFKASRGLTPGELNKIIQSRIELFDEAIDLPSKAETDYRGTATVFGIYGFRASAKEAIETADYLKAFLEGVKKND